MSQPEQGKTGAAGRPNDPPFLILTSLTSGPTHGYALMQDIAEFASVRLGPGSLYGAISRLEERGFIEPVGTESRARPYRLTSAGRAALEARVVELRTVVDEAAARLSGVPRVATSAGGR